MNKDEEHLKLLSIFHYVVGGLAAFFACFPIIHLLIGIAMLTGHFEQASSNGEFPAFLFGLMFVLIPGFIMLCGWALAICLIIAGRHLAKKKYYMFCFSYGLYQLHFYAMWNSFRRIHNHRIDTTIR